MLAIYPIKTPRIFRFVYPSAIWHKSRNKKVIYLSFDDGPIPEVTEQVLNILSRYHAKATFFCIGDNIQKHPDIFKKIKDNGHLVGNHTFNHLKGWETEADTYIENTQFCQNLTQTPFFRPPYGRFTLKQYNILKKLGYHIILWDVLSGDFDPNLTQEKCLKGVIRYTGSGSIVVFHDSMKAKRNLLYVLPRALEYWKKQGYDFKTLVE